MFAQSVGWDWSLILEPRTLVFIMAGTVAVAAMVLPHWRRVREVEASARLKQKMLERGFSADEIERVLSAGHDCPPTEPSPAKA